VDEPRRRIDPVALAVLGVVGVAIVGIGAYVAVSYFRYQPAPAVAPVAARQPRPGEAREAPPQKQAAPVPLELITQHGAGRVWTYRVTLEPPHWRDASLSYRLVLRNGNRYVESEFRHAGGQSKFVLGTFLAGDPSHANLRFPGFFMHVAYLDRPLEVGQRFAWQWPWQMPDGRVVAGRVKRYDGEVKAWENLPAPPSLHAPMDTFFVARIETTLSYIENGAVQASTKETLWYAPRYLQVVKVVRDGQTPDEAARHIVAELVGHDAR